MYDAKSSVWKKIGSMKKARVYHAASLVNMGDVIDFCIWSVSNKNKTVPLNNKLIYDAKLFKILLMFLYTFQQVSDW